MLLASWRRSCLVSILLGSEKRPYCSYTDSVCASFCICMAILCTGKSSAADLTTAGRNAAVCRTVLVLTAEGLAAAAHPRAESLLRCAGEVGPLVSHSQWPNWHLWQHATAQEHCEESQRSLRHCCCWPSCRGSCLLASLHCWACALTGEPFTGIIF